MTVPAGRIPTHVVAVEDPPRTATGPAWRVRVWGRPIYHARSRSTPAAPARGQPRCDPARPAPGRSRLGKMPSMPPQRQLLDVSLNALRPNPDQPRKTFDEDALQELAESIKHHGVIQPIAIKRDPERVKRYLVIAGERRVRAARLAGQKTIPAILVIGRGDELALIENLQREDLSPVEEAEALKGLMERPRLHPRPPRRGHRQGAQHRHQPARPQRPARRDQEGVRPVERQQVAADRDQQGQDPQGTAVPVGQGPGRRHRSCPPRSQGRPQARNRATARRSQPGRVGAGDGEVVRGEAGTDRGGRQPHQRRGVRAVARALPAVPGVLRATGEALSAAAAGG